MTAEQDPGTASERVQSDAEEVAGYLVRARVIEHVQIGDHNVQINYDAGERTWADRPGAPPLATVSGHIESPYRGLSAFEERDAPFFFGRETAATDVLERMAGCIGGPGLLMVSGASGAGKSSLLRGGILPRLRRNGLPGEPAAQRWPCQLFAPSDAPLDELALCVASLAGVDATSVRDALGRDSSAFALIARQAALAHTGGAGERADGHQARLLLVVDQFEQLFTRCADEMQRRAFIAALHAAATAPCEEGRVAAGLVVVLVREDFEARCTDYPELVEAVQHRHLVTPMRELELRAAITEPARIAGARVEQGLVEALLEELRSRAPVPGGDRRFPAVSGAGLLPQMSHALDKAWRGRADETVLSLTDYVCTGGIQDALAHSAQDTYDALTSGQQTAARQVFVHLTAAAGNGISLANRATRNELIEGRPPDQVRDVEAVLEAFAAQRLLTLAADTVEISHEVLLSSWPLLRDVWLTETHADRLVRTRLRATAAEWAKDKEDSSYLYSGSLLQAATETCARIAIEPTRHPPLSSVERNFLSASDRARLKRSRRQRGFVAFLMVLVLGLATTTVRAYEATQSSNHQRDIAVSRQLIAQSETLGDTDPAVARLDSLVAWRIHHSPEARYAMVTAASLPGLAVLTGHTDTVWSVAFRPDGKILATAGGDGTARLWNAATHRQIGHPLTGHNGSVNSVAFRPDGKILATAGADGTARLWDATAHRQIGHPLTGHNGSVNSVAFSPDGKILATAGGDGAARLWDAATHHQIGHLLTAGANEVNSVVFSPNGKIVATAGTDRAVRLWDVSTHHQIGGPLTGHTREVISAAFSPDGRRLAATGSDGTVRLWDVATHRQTGQPLSGHNAPVTSSAFSPDGRRLATTGFDGTVRLWDVATHQQIGQSLTGHAGPVNSTAFSPDGKTLATAGADRTVRLWDVYGHEQIGEPLADHVLPMNSAFSPDGRLLASAGADGVVRLWDVATHRQVGHPFAGHKDAVNSVAFSPDGRTLVSAGADGTVRLWDVATHQQVGRSLVSHNTSVTSSAFSPDGRRLATTGFDGTVRLWDVSTHEQIGRPLTGYGSGGWTSAVFSPNGKTLAAAGEDHTVRLWEVASRREIGRPLTGHAGPVNSVAFSPDGRTLASASADGTVRLWNVATRQQIGRPVSTGPVNSAAFSPDGKTVATAGADGTLRLWDVATHQQIGRPLTGDISRLWSVTFSPDGKALASTSADQTVRLWNVGYLVNVLDQLCAEVGHLLTRSSWARYVPSGPEYQSVCP